MRETFILKMLVALLLFSSFGFRALWVTVHSVAMTQKVLMPGSISQKWPGMAVPVLLLWQGHFKRDRTFLFRVAVQVERPVCDTNKTWNWLKCYVFYNLEVSSFFFCMRVLLYILHNSVGRKKSAPPTLFHIRSSYSNQSTPFCIRVPLSHQKHPSHQKSPRCGLGKISQRTDVAFRLQCGDSYNIMLAISLYSKLIVPSTLLKRQKWVPLNPTQIFSVSDIYLYHLLGC